MSNMNGTPSLADVARLSGVSASTVSRVLNKRSEGFSVRDETRQRILTAADELRYRPDPIIRSIRAKHTNLIAVLGMRDFGTGIRGTTEEAANNFREKLYEAGYELCTNIMSPKEPPFSVPRWRVDGAVVLDCSDPHQLQSLDRSGVPYVSINGECGPQGSSVTVDDIAGTRDAIHHLMAMGHRRIAYVGPDEEGHRHESLEARHLAHVKTLEEVGIEPITPELIALEPAMSVLRRVVVERKATAVLVYHHIMAIKLCRAAMTLGLRVPQQVSVVCFNDVFPCEDMVPSLTAMSLPTEEMGSAAARLLLERIKDPDAQPRHIQLKEQLIIRESTAPSSAA